MKAQLILNVGKVIKGAKIPAGTVIANLETEQKFTVEDVDIAMQLSEVKISTVAEKKKP